MGKPKKPNAHQATGKKRGLSSAELSQIRQLAHEGNDPEIIATIVGRRADVVVRAINRMGGTTVPEDPTLPPDLRAKPPGPAPSRKNAILAALRASSNFQQLRRQLSNPELRFYEDNWAEILEQFGDDVTATEKVSLGLVVMFMVQQARNAEDQLTARKEADRAAREAARLESIYPDSLEFPRAADQQAKIDACYRQMIKAEQRLTQLSATYAQATREQQNLFEDLKSTRNQRLDRATKVDNVQSLLKQLLDEKRREAEGRRAELMRQSMTAEAERLSTPHEFADGQIDLPLLTPETVLAQRRPSSRRAVGVSDSHGQDQADAAPTTSPVSDGGGEAAPVFEGVGDGAA